ncbi:hypothetical protein B9P86_08040 [Citrobacter freundii]|nr:hypothetical protein B9P86_08040 [Citrobacter freundii]PCQ45613.1 hypothetical protein CQA31_20660 [Citrobacter freundii]QBI31678.1 hypothetical protein WN16_22280 [Citrobacter sp. ABFQG]
MCVGCVRSPQSLTLVSSWGFAPLPPSCNSNYLGYIRFLRYASHHRHPFMDFSESVANAESGKVSPQ